MSSSFNRTLSQIESMVRNTMNERSERKKREEQLALHKMATERQNARSDRLQGLREKNQEVINRGFDINKDLRRGRDVMKLESGEITPEQFNLRYKESIDMQPKSMPGQITDQDLLKSWTEYRKNETNLNPMEFDEFKARYGQNNRTNLGNIVENPPLKQDIRETTFDNNFVGPPEYGTRSFSNKPVERSLASVGVRAPTQGPLMPNVVDDLQESAIPGVSNFATGAKEGLSKPLVMTPDIARNYFQQANGDKELARKMAREDGFVW